MKHHLSFFLLSFLLVGCNHPGLNETQRQQLKEGKVNRTIHRVTDAQILEVTSTKGETVFKTLTSPNDTSMTGLRAIWVYDSAKIHNTKMAQIQDAYLYSKENKLALPPHVEQFNTDSLLFVKPAHFQNKEGLWFILFDKREIVKSIE
ncbi:MAG: hypothetical protein OEX22_02225 [Cyclobacteriaceae bacterium]|nr:hypothetical protein [Cyclobacteriaceae bacterium]